MDTLLVLGSVTSKQYKPLRMVMIRNGLRPKIVRISVEQLDRYVSYLKAYSLGNSGYAVERAQTALAHGEVKAVVYEDVSDTYRPQEVSPRDWDLVLDHVKSSVALYKLEVFSDGSSQLTGTGFGRDTLR